jgi:hypothetical protein
MGKIRALKMNPSESRLSDKSKEKPSTDDEAQSQSG